MRKSFLLIALVAGFLAAGLIDFTLPGAKSGVSVPALADEAGAQFAWHPNRPGVTRAQIALGRAATLKFEFTVRGLPDGTPVKFGIPKKYVEIGVVVDPKEVVVKQGVARSMAIFAVPPGMPLGRFDMPVVAVNANTNKELGRGAIPFMLLPAGVGGC